MLFLSGKFVPGKMECTINVAGRYHNGNAGNYTSFETIRRKKAGRKPVQIQQQFFYFFEDEMA